jgi:hypothetical protein
LALPRRIQRLGENDLVPLVESERPYLKALPAQFKTYKDKVLAILDKLLKSSPDPALEAPASAAIDAPGFADTGTVRFFAPNTIHQITFYCKAIQALKVDSTFNAGQMPRIAQTNHNRKILQCSARLPHLKVS